MSHTPGPWRFQQDGGEPYWSVDMPLRGGDRYGFCNAMVYTTEADARLIAAAPEILEALKMTVSLLKYAATDGGIRGDNADEWWGMEAQCDAAIAKADGRE